MESQYWQYGTEQYFSFFGAVRTAPDSLAARDIASWYGSCADQDAREDLYNALDDARHSDPYDGTTGAIYEDSDGTETAIWPFPDNSAVLIVANRAGGWAEIGAVQYPLEFTAPAAVAGACCNPQYGIS